MPERQSQWQYVKVKQRISLFELFRCFHLCFHAVCCFALICVTRHHTRHFPLTLCSYLLQVARNIVQIRKGHAAVFKQMLKQRNSLLTSPNPREQISSHRHVIERLVVLEYGNHRPLTSNSMIRSPCLLYQSHLHPPLIKHCKFMLNKLLTSPTMDSVGLQGDSRRSYKQWEEKHSRIMQEPPREGREYINHAINILPFIEAISEACPIAKG